ncbi:MAG: hypothetical protein HN742_22385 [Lentisphaerae bacterium]|nr:hypothetical protein [Lentisphaerota bacterium]MBT5606751.1 hypothetical protein [Lentisphaerota bacterium]MBT7058870.1 hypothetical protein [Lentisphaerota bacterium]MBT7844642.1 hypothetical protein [Lentisphaerota bacterium]
MTRLLPHVTPREEYSKLVAILEDPARWKEAHDCFDAIRLNVTLATGSHRLRTVDDYFTNIAENAAKTAYNCSGESAPFDNASFDRLLAWEQKLLERKEEG